MAIFRVDSIHGNGWCLWWTPLWLSCCFPSVEKTSRMTLGTPFLGTMTDPMGLVYFGSGPLPGCNRDHQDCYILNRESRTKPSFTGAHPRYIYLYEWLILMVNVGKYTIVTWILWVELFHVKGFHKFHPVCGRVDQLLILGINSSHP